MGLLRSSLEVEFSQPFGQLPNKPLRVLLQAEASFSTAAPMPRGYLADWRHRRLPSHGRPHWPPPYSGPASSRATARHPSIGTDPEAGVACRLLLCWLSPAGRLASGPPVRRCPAEVACAGYVLPSRPSPWSGLSPPLSTRTLEAVSSRPWF